MDLASFFGSPVLPTELHLLIVISDDYKHLLLICSSSSPASLMVGWLRAYSLQGVYIQ